MEKAKLIKIAMVKKNIKNFSELATIMGEKRQNVQMFMKTLQTGKPREETLNKYAKVLDIPVEKLK